MALEQKQHLLDPDEEPPDPGGVSELVRHRLNISSNEKALAGINAVQGSLGTTSLFSNFLLFACYTSLEQGGLGLTISTAVSIGALAGVSVVTVLLTIPLSIYAYKDYMQEAEKLVAEITYQEIKRKSYREKLFLELLRLRHLYAEDEIAFSRQANVLMNKATEIDKNKLLALVKSTYLNPKLNAAYVIPTAPFDTKSLTSHSERSLKSLLSNSSLLHDPKIRKDFIVQLQHINSKWKKQLSDCYRPIATLPTVKRATAINYGLGGFLAMFSMLFGTSTAFAQICITAGFAGALTATGWGALIVVAVVASVFFAASYGMGKQLNFQREELQNQLEKRNTELKSVKNSVKQACTQRYLHNLQLKSNSQIKKNLALENKCEALQKELNDYKTQHENKATEKSAASSIGFFSPAGIQCTPMNELAAPGTAKLVTNKLSMSSG